MFRFFEQLVQPHPDAEPGQPPDKLIPFVWHCTEGMRPHIAVMTLATALIGVFEAVRVDETIRRLINDNGDEAIIARHAFLNAPNLGSAARELVRTGQTTAEEAIRISRREAEPVPPETIDG